MKRQYKYFVKTIGETIGIVEALNREEAVVIASERKRLDIDSFLSIYDVKEVV